MEKFDESAANRAQLEVAVLAVSFAAALAAGAGICYGGAPVLLAGTGVAVIWGLCSFALEFADWHTGPPAAALAVNRSKLLIASRLALNARLVLAASLIVPLSRVFA